MTIYYVATSGNDLAKGTADSPWRTIGQAMNAKLKPGDEVVVRSGTYKEAVVVNKDGSAAGAITLRSEVPGGAKIVPPDTKAGITILGDYVTVDGFDVSGSQGSGITGVHVHHVTLTHNIVHDNVSNGIFLGEFDFATIEGNVVYGNAARGAASGIHLKAAVNLTGSLSDDYRIIVRGNVSYANATEYGRRPTAAASASTTSATPRSRRCRPVPSRALSRTTSSSPTPGAASRSHGATTSTIRDNVSMANNADGRTGLWLGELVNMGSHHNIWTGNIAVSDAGNPAIGNLTYKGDPTNANVTWSGNATYNGKTGEASTYSNFGGSKPGAEDNLLGHDPEITLAELKGLAEDLRTTGSFELPRIGDGDPSGPSIIGDAGDNLILGGAGGDTLSGGAGNDKLYGGAGNDLISGGSGSDGLVGGNGVDIMAGGGGGDTFTFRYAANAAKGRRDLRLLAQPGRQDRPSGHRREH